MPLRASSRVKESQFSQDQAGRINPARSFYLALPARLRDVLPFGMLAR
jgi:hypothetical protein